MKTKNVFEIIQLLFALYWFFQLEIGAFASNSFNEYSTSAQVLIWFGIIWSILLIVISILSLFKVHFQNYFILSICLISIILFMGLALFNNMGLFNIENVILLIYNLGLIYLTFLPKKLERKH